jgi:tRNA dimethylallyltransferase
MSETALLAIGGPTGSGKSDLAIHLAEWFDGEIVNFDSLQVYRGFDIGTAKVPPGERRGIAHHLVDICDPEEIYTAGDFASDATRAIRAIASRGRLPILAGGTGFYLRSLLEGLSASPSRDEALRARLEKRESHKPGSLHRLLSRLDRAAAAKIHARDKNKVIRALELRLLAGMSREDHFAEAPPAGLAGCRTLLLVLEPPRVLLRERLDARSESIWRGGILEETRQLLNSGVGPDAKPFASLGYKQALAFLRGECEEADALEEMKVRTRQYAKRQLTWFRTQHRGAVLAGFGPEDGVRRAARRETEKFLSA